MNLSTERNRQKFQDLLNKLELTDQNKELAEQYLDLTEPEDKELLTKVEHQDFSEISKELRYELGEYLSNMNKREPEELIRRYIQFMTEIGGSTAQFVLCGNGYDSEVKYVEQYLPPVQAIAVRADMIVWNSYNLSARGISSLVEIGKEHPEYLLQAMELCYDKDASNTKMLLSAIYLYCVRPLEEMKSVLFIPPTSEDTRAKDSKEHIQEVVDYLEKRLIKNSSGLFASGARPSEEDVEKFQNFVKESDPYAPFPQELIPIYSGRKLNNYQMRFLSFCAFLAVEHSNRFVELIRLAVALDGDTIPNSALYACYTIGNEWFDKHIEAMEKVLFITAEAYIRTAILWKEKEILVRMSKKSPDTIRKVIQKVPIEDYGYLVAQLKHGNLALYQELGTGFTDNYRRLVASQHVKGLIESEKAEKYLLGEAEIDDILPYVHEWRECYIYGSWRTQKEDQIKLLLECGEVQMYQRAIVLNCLRLKDGFASREWINVSPDAKPDNNFSKMFDKRQIKGILKLCEDENVPVRYQLDYFGAVYDELSESTKKVGRKKGAEVFAENNSKWKSEFIEAAKNGMLVTRLFVFQIMDLMYEEYKEELLSCAIDSAKQAKEFLQIIYAGHKEWEPEILSMLQSKKGAEREMAVQVLRRWGVEAYRETLTNAMEIEKSKKLKELMQSILSVDGQAFKEEVELTLDETVAAILKGGRKRRISWFLHDGLPKVHKKDGDLKEEVSEDYLAAILVAYADMNVPGVNADALKLAAPLHPTELSAYIKLLFNSWMKSGAEAKKKWVLYAASIHGGEEIVPILYNQIQEWPKVSRGALAAEAIKALALNGTPTALLLVDQTARKFKFRQVKTAAAEALTYAAEQLQITRAELEDRIVPNLGFDENMERIFDYGSRSFKVLLNTGLELEVYDENNKKLKSLPAPGKKDEPEKSKAASDEFKLLKKQLKTVVSNQKLRLEQALGMARLWQVDKWKELFVQNPVMHQFAMGLIWGLYENGTLKDTFRYMEDGTFNTMDEDEYELPKNGTIGLVHPIELKEEDLSTWKEQLSDYEVTQPVEQLERPIYIVTEEEKDKKELIRFGGKLLNGLSLSGKLQGMGWYRGSVQDAGGYYTFYREDGEIGVELEFSGSYIGDENGEVTVYGAKFYKAGTVKRGSYVYDTIKAQDEYTLSEVNPRYFSEIVLQLTKATASSKEKLIYPQCKDNRPY